MDLMKIWWKGVDWMYLTQDRDQWQALIIMIMNLQVSWTVGNFCT